MDKHTSSTHQDKTNQELRVHSLKINDTITENHNMITNTFNRYFTSVPDSIYNNVKSSNNDHKNTNYMKYLFNSFKHPF